MIPALIPILGSAVGTLIDRLVPDEAERAKAKMELEAKLFEAANAANMAQIDLNKVEAASGKGGWRWGAGWLCVLSLAYAWIVRDLLAWGLALAFPGVPPLPTVDVELQYGMLTGMLGLGGIRAFDLSKGSRR